jgi:hypothetical protein
VFINLRDAMDTTITATVDASLCALPPYTERHGQFSGYFSVGFEENRFFPVPDSGGGSWMYGGHPESRHAQVSWSEAGLRQRLPWPRGDSLASSTCYQVSWVGTLRGPGEKTQPKPGQVILGRIAAYTFVVDSTIAVALAAPSKCTGN